MADEGGSAGAAALPVAKLEELAGPGPFAASAGGEELVLVRAGEALRAYEGRCPHLGALLAEGEVEGADLVCRNHRWRFDLDTGLRRDGPGGLRACPLQLRDGAVYARPGALAAPRASGRLRTLRDLPGPRRLPVIGNLPSLGLDRLHTTLERWARRYGPAYRVDFGPRPMIVMSEAEHIQKALRERPETFRRLGTIEPVFKELGVDGVFSAEGVAWRPLRRLTMEALAPAHLRSFYPTLRAVAERLRRRWAAEADAGRAVALEEDFKRFTVDLTTQLAFGHDLNTLEDDGDVLQRKLEHVFPGLTRRLFAPVPWWRLVRLPVDRRLERAVAEVMALLREILAAARARLAADPSRAGRPANFLEAMVAARDEAGQPFSDGEVLGNAIQLLLAGEDTTALTLTWAVHELCDDPGSAAALAAEASAVLGASGVPADLETAGRLAAAAAVAQETMRLRPVAPILIVQANRDTALGDVAIPAGQSVCLLMREPAVAERHFAEPERFRPARWLERAPGAAHDASAHMPFGSGPRLCPGRSLALLEMRVALATLFRGFVVERVGPRQAVAERFAFTMAPVGLSVLLRRRA